MMMFFVFFFFKLNNNSVKYKFALKFSLWVLY